MFEGDKIVIPESDNDQSYNSDKRAWQRFKKPLIIGGLILFVLVIIFLVVLFLIKASKNSIDPIDFEKPKEVEVVVDYNTLPNLNGDDEGEATSTIGFNPNNLDIEYLSFSDFYSAPDNTFTSNIDNYSLPINIKVDGFNYYGLSRKLNLDPGIDDLNTNGFTVLENPWQNEIDDFYSIYRRLEEKQIPLLITSDFMVYYHQNMMKQIYKEIEEGIFYDYLWGVNKKLYEIAKNRYENRLAAIGNINDVILEGLRMEMAFFAVSLELLKPAPEQVAVKGAIEDKSKFTEGDVLRFNFMAPTYLRDDVLREVQLIKSGRDKIKSPNLLYVSDYKKFAVPREYSSDARLNNFFLASNWLSSLFPLEYRSESCPDCLLDQEDWRINMVAASLIATDLSANDGLKSQWAIIYKLMAFFQGLREELDYVDFRDSLISVFGDDYDIEKLFNGESKEVMENLEKLKIQLLKHEFSEIRGAIDKNKEGNTKYLGFKILTGAYWPNDYIFSRLTWPKIGSYQGEKIKKNNITFCMVDNQPVRCNSFALDIANLVNPISDNDLFEENTNYLNYKSSSKDLLKKLNRDGIWHTSNYWSTISLMKSIMTNNVDMPIFASSRAWQDQKTKTAVSAWVNLQLPLDRFSLTPIFKGNTLDASFILDDNIYVEPNLSLINELLAINNMVADTFLALGLNKEINLAVQAIKGIDEDLKMLQAVIIKELSGEEIGQDEAGELRDFAKRYQVDKSSKSDKVLKHETNLSGKSLSQDISRLKLMALIYQSNGNKLLVVGPVWNYKENR